MARYNDRTSRSQKDDINMSSAMSDQAKKLVEDTLNAMSAGVNDVSNVVNQGKGNEAVGIKSAEKQATEISIKAQKTQEFEAKERKNKSKQNVFDKGLSKKEKNNLNAKGRDGASATGDNPNFEKETRKNVEKATKSLQKKLEKEFKGRKISTPNSKKVAKSMSEDGDAKLEIKVKNGDGKEISIKADSEKGSIEEEIKNGIEKEETSEEKLQRLRGTSSKSKKRRSAGREKVLHNNRSSQQQNIASTRLSQKRAASR